MPTAVTDTRKTLKKSPLTELAGRKMLQNFTALAACAVLGFYVGNDARINSTIPKSEELMKAAGKPYDVVIYEGAGHGFMKAGQAPPPAADAGAKAGEMYAANKKAREAGWQRWLAQLKTL